MTETIEEYCEEIEQNVDRIHRNSEEYSDQIVDLAGDFRDAVNGIRDESESAKDKYFELKDRAVELNHELEKSYQALEKMATIEEQHQKTRRWVVGTGIGVALTSLAGIGAHHFSTAHSGDGVSQAEISDIGRVSDYLETEVIGNRMLSSEDNWGDLLNIYDEESGEFFADSDKTLNGIDITLNEDPGERSEYGARIGIGQEEEYVTEVLEEDKAAESALKFFGEI